MLVNNKIIIVDLDNTFIKTDLLYEAFVQLIKFRFWLVFLMPIWLIRGKLYFKKKIFEGYSLREDLLPYNYDVINYIKDKWNSGHKIYLYSASPEEFVKKIANKFEFFSGFRGSTNINLKSINKLKAIIEDFGENFDYIGDSLDDIVIWNKAINKIAVNPNKKIFKFLSKDKFEKIFTYGNNLKSLIKLIRVHQWSKNFLVFTPYIIRGDFSDISLLINFIIIFFCISLISSGTYIINDLFDLNSDRLHPSKKNRPLANGDTKIIYAIYLAPILIISGLLISYNLSINAFLSLISYIIITLSYSLYFKKLAILDVILIAGLFTLRVIAGSLLIEEPISHWLLAFTFTIFFSLAISKRVSDIKLIIDSSDKKNLDGRGYKIEDEIFLTISGISSGFASILIFSLYLVLEQFKRDIFSNNEFLWFVCMLIMFWMLRIWFKTCRGEIKCDPVIFALKDKTSIIMGLFSLIFIYFAW